MSDAPTIQILLVEDHPADVTLTRKAFSQLATPNHVHVVIDGKEAMLFLRQKGRYAKAPRPDLILLDLNMPRMSGTEVLEAIDQEESLRAIPILILTTSSAPDDVYQAYLLRANSYLVKPVKFADFQDLIGHVETFWFRAAILPKAPPP
jgi:CheY-like chemotaxis protein